MSDPLNLIRRAQWEPAGLDVGQLISTLKRHRIDCELIEGDEAVDHCLLRVLPEYSPNSKCRSNMRTKASSLAWLR